MYRRTDGWKDGWTSRWTNICKDSYITLRMKEEPIRLVQMDNQTASSTTIFWSLPIYRQKIRIILLYVCIFQQEVHLSPAL